MKIDCSEKKIKYIKSLHKINIIVIIIKTIFNYVKLKK